MFQVGTGGVNFITFGSKYSIECGFQNTTLKFVAKTLQKYLWEHSAVVKLNFLKMNSFIDTFLFYDCIFFLMNTFQ